MHRRFSKKKGGMPSFGNRGDAGRGQRVHSLLPRSRNMSLDPRVPEFVLPPPPPPTLNPSVPEFVLPPPSKSEVIFEIGRDDVYYPATHFEHPRDRSRFNKLDDRYPGIKFAYDTHFSGEEIKNKVLNADQKEIEKMAAAAAELNKSNRGGGKQRKKKSSRRQTRQKKQQRRHRTRRHSSRKYRK